MTSLKLVALPLIAILAGCVPQLQKNTHVDSFLVLPGTTFLPTMLCGTTEQGDACISMENGREVKSVLKSSFQAWTKSLINSEDAEQTISGDRTAFVINKLKGKEILAALVKDNEKRRSERRRKDD